MQLVSMRRAVKLDRLAHIPSTPPNFEQGDNLYANAKILYTKKNDVTHPAMAVLKQLQQMDVATTLKCQVIIFNIVVLLLNSVNPDWYAMLPNSALLFT